MAEELDPNALRAAIGQWYAQLTEGDPSAAGVPVEGADRIAYLEARVGELHDKIGGLRSDRDLLLWLHAEAVWEGRQVGDRYVEVAASRQAWAEEAMRLDVALQVEQKRLATDALVYDRYCCWPGCFASFSVLTGPSDARWVQVNAAGHFVFCPDHTDTGHRPQKFHWEPGWKVVQMSCECGAEGNDLVPANTDRCREWWTAHAASLRVSSSVLPDGEAQ